MQYRQRPAPPRAGCDELLSGRCELPSTRMNVAAGSGHNRPASTHPSALMKSFACLAAAALLAACTVPASREPAVAAAPAADAAVLAPNPNLVVQGIPPIP